MYQMLVSNDWHIPLHDPRSCQLVVDIAEDLAVEYFVINGDLADFYLLNSHHKKDPEVEFTLEDEIFQCNEWLDIIQKQLKDTKIHYIMGNHEDRLDRFIRDNCPVFWNRLTVENEFRLKERGITQTPYNERWRVKGTDLYIQHSPPSYGVNGARTSLLAKPGASHIWGCTHRMQQAHITDALGKIRSTYFNGWLGSTTLTNQHKAVFKYTKNHENWQQGFSIVTVIGQETFVNQYQIKDYRVVVGGNVYEG